jgi:hypothetical protein
MLTERLALYTTVYPGVEKYLSAWYDSIKAQTDQNFDVWIGVDSLDVGAVTEAMGANPSVRWVLGRDGDSPAQIRQRAIENMVRQSPAVVFADSDDVLDPTRVDAARGALQKHDVSGCAMRMIGEDGRDLGLTFQLPAGAEASTILPRYNVFGLSNTAYRSEVLGRCLPVPADCVLVDWFLATYAWTSGARLHFDSACRMAYRQHANNTAPVLPPFTHQQVVSAAERVLRHFAFILTRIPELQPQHRAEVETAQNLVEGFYTTMRSYPDITNQYVCALNQLPRGHIWWDIVAHPHLEEIWKSQTFLADRLDPANPHILLPRSDQTTTAI